MFTALSNLVKSFFSALERFAKALDYIGQVAEESAAIYADEARINRAKQNKQLTQELKAIK